MKLFVVLALAAAAVADPLLYKAYNPWGYSSLGYGYSVHSPLTTVGYPAYGFPTTRHLIGKREAEAEPEAAADAYYNYGFGLGYSGYTGFTGLNHFGYRNFGYPYATRHYIGKREAEAEADPALLRSYYAHGAVSPYHGYGFGYSGLPAYKTYSGFGYPMFTYGLGK